MKRRDFIKGASRLSTLVTLSSVGVPLSIFGDEKFGDYKALVIILLHGGNDSINMFLPIGDDAKTGYKNYASIRTSLKADEVDLRDKLTVNNGNLELLKEDKNPYYQNSSISQAYTKGFYSTNIKDIGVNALMPELAHLVNQNRVAIVANMGTLHEPTTKKDILDKKVKLPIYLFSHNTQRRLFATADALKQKKIGWAGHLADIWGDINNSVVYGLNIGIDGLDHSLYGKKTTPISISRGGPSKYGMDDNEKAIFNKLLNLSNSNEFYRLYSSLRSKSFVFQEILNKDWSENSPKYSSTNAYGDKLFSHLSTKTIGVSSSDSIGSRLFDKLKAVSRLAYIGKNKGLKREIFFVKMGGYDTHGNQAKQHARLLRELSGALGDFQKSLDELNLSKNVVTFNISDFGRSIGNNGDGTDHAWGGHYFVMGDSVKAGLYGELPDLTLGGDDDISRKGRLIPKISVTQYYSTILKWFGVDDKTLDILFPELSNFSVRDLGFMQKS